MRVSRCAVVKSQAATCCLCFTEEAENFWKIFFFFLQSTWPPPVYVTDKSAACHLPLAALSILVSMHTWTKHAFRPFWTTKSDKALTVGSRSSKTLNFLPNKAARSSADDGPIPHFLGGRMDRKEPLLVTLGRSGFPFTLRPCLFRHKSSDCVPRRWKKRSCYFRAS